MLKEFQSKSIILFIPYHFGVPIRFKKNLEYLGFNVFLPEEISSEIFKLPLFEKLIHGYKKFVKKDKTHKLKVYKKIYEKYYLNYIENLSYCDYALVIRPDLLTTSIIKKLKTKAKHVVCYQWDGMSRYTPEQEMIKEFDKFFIFDVKDIKKYPKSTPITNFYFDDIIEPLDHIEKDVFFIGSYLENRINQLFDICTFFDKNNYITDINLVCDTKKHKIDPKYNINIYKQGISFEENILKLKKAKCILDFKNDVHYGLSFRTFESIGYKKKLITNNELVKKYDFYNPNNIFVFENSSFDGLEEFLKKPYEELSQEIYQKYSFTNWIKDVLDIEPYIKIDVPHE